MHVLADAGLTNREACYNTVRNVTACPWSGIAHDEVFDVRPYAQRLAYAFLRKDLTGNLPRKFKIRVRRLRLARLHAGRHSRCRPARRDPRRPARFPHGDRRRPRAAAHRGATAGRVPPRRAPAQPVRSGAARFQPLRQPPEQEQGAHEVRHARARLRVAQGTDRKGVPGYPRQRRHRVARHGSGRLRRLSVAAAAAGRRRAAPGAAAATIPRTRRTTRGSKPTSWSRGRPATPS